MRRTPVRAWGLALLSAALQILIFPKPALYFLCWIAFVPLLYTLIRGRGGEGELLDADGRSLRPFTLRQGFVLGWLCGILWYLGTCYWIYPVMHGYGHLDAVTSTLITIAFCLLMGGYHGLFGLLIVLMARRSSSGNRRPLLLAPFFWVAIELLRDHLIADPWNPLGNAQINNIPFARIAQVTGVYGLSFAIMLVNCAFTAGLLLQGRRRLNLLLSAGAAAIALQMGMFARFPAFAASRQAVLVQPNLPIPDVPWSQAEYDRTIADLARISVMARPKNPAGSPGLIIWPESPAPFEAEDPRFLHWISAVAQAANSFMISGSYSVAENPDSRRQLIYNSALVADPQGDVVGRYDKIHLVPFGEYVPFQNLLFFAGKLTREVGDFTPGQDRKVFDLDGTRAGVFICYESIFPDEVRQFADNGAQVLVNISDDGWYGETSAPFQHLDMTRMRAIENHRWLLLSTNTGTSAAIDPYGRVVKSAPRDVRTAVVVPFSPESGSTFYTRNGDVFAWICVVISIAAVFVRFRFRTGTMIPARSA